jgi:hypothetical protein
MNEIVDRVAAAIEKHFLADGKWELDVNENPPPHIIPGRWLWLSDANYGFRPVDLARDMIEAMRELPSDPGPRYTAGEYSRRTQAAMVDEALGKVDA